ncbi:MAG: penicillin acylase family protein [Planctomycetes bacterium]|nr:penicillin acylase family protein [Planctomycetota bacterium]
MEGGRRPARRERRRSRPLAAFILPFLGLPAPTMAQSQNWADVYRDDQGVPHIVAESEENAWYAMGR